MDDWFEASMQTLDRMAEALEKQIVTVAEQVENVADKTADAAGEALEKLGQQMSDAIPPETLESLDRQVEQLEASMESAGIQTMTFLEEAFRPVGQTINPVVNEHKTCIGCRYYEGSDFGGNMLVCGIHPYGCQSEICPDYEAVWKV